VKALIKKALVWGSSFLSLVLLSPIQARADNTNQMPHASFDKDQIIWGEMTNGIKAGVQIYNHKPPFWIFVYVQRAGNLLPVVFPGTNFVSDLYEEAPFYLGATNSFCGPVELRDAAAKELPLLKPDFSLPESYPDRLSWIYLWRLHAHHTIAPGYHMPNFLSVNESRYQLNSFYLTNYFKIEKTGDYQLTVWPKIYKRSENDKDVYQRIDIPSVTVTIHWEAN
jgi:hypothetical protein